MSSKDKLENDITNFLKNRDFNLESSIIDGMTLNGKLALSKYIYIGSDFWKYACIPNNVVDFGVDTRADMKLYHYTTNESFEKILSSKYFRIKSYKYMNDINEFKWASKIAVEYLSSIGANGEEIESFESKVKNPPYEYCYIWSFTQNNDSQNLFNTYGGKSGLALEFSLQNLMYKLAILNSHGKNTLDDLSYGDAYVFPMYVEYNKEKQKEYIYHVVHEWLMAYRSFDEAPSYMDEIMLICEKNMFLFNICFKNPLLYQEEEVRFLIIKIGEEKKLIDIEVDGVDYTKCPIDTDMINTVKIQTGNNINKYDIQQLLLKYHINAKIIKSELPY